MTNVSIFLPMLVQITLTLAMFILLGIRKSSALKSGEFDRTKTALDNSAWCSEVVKVSNNIANQFQTPVLFYILSIVFFLTNSVTTLVLALSWIYVITRIMHAFVHVTSNKISLRLSSFTVGVICLMGLVVIAFVTLLG